MTGKLEYKSAALSIDDTGTITGIAWPFGSPDSAGDVINKGAITVPKTLPMLFAHDQAQVVGVWDDITETDAGLIVKGRMLIDDVERAREVRAMIQSKAISGLSIGFRPIKAQPRQNNRRGRNISALSIHEISIVAVPSHPDAQVTSIKSADILESNFSMENEEHNEIETKSEIIVSPEMVAEIKSLKSDLATVKAKLNRPSAALNDPEAKSGELEIKSFNTDFRQAVLEKKALTISLPGTGGNLVNDAFMAQILEKIGKGNPIRQLANSIKLDAGLLKIPRLVSGVTPGSVTEIETKPTSTPSFEQITIEPYMMGAQVLVSRSQLEDSAVNLFSWITDHIASRFAELESNWFVNGDGTTQAEGVLTSAEVQEITTGSAILSVDDLLDLLYSVKSSYANAGSWVMNRKTARLIRGLKDSDGNLIWEHSIQNGEPGRILGQAVYMADDMPDPVAGNTPIIFGDFHRGYLITDRIAFEPEADYSKYSENDLVQFVGRRRVGGKVVMGEALTKLKFAA